MNHNGDGPEKIKVFCVSPIAQTPSGAGGRFAMIPEWAAGVKLLTKTAQRVDIALGSLCNADWGEERVVQASLSEIARLTKIDRRHAARAIHDLELAGRLQRRRRLTKFGGYDSTEYLLLDRSGGSGKTPPLGSGKNTHQVVAERRHQVLPELGAPQIIEEERHFRSLKKENGHDAYADPVQKALFEAGRRVLDGHRSRRQAGALVGKWRKQVGRDGDAQLLALFTQVLRNRISDPVGYIEQAIKRLAMQSEFGPGYRPMASAAGG
jgi:hypothetical protein